MLNLVSIIGLAIAFIALTVAFAPAINTAIISAPTSDPNASSLMLFIIPALFGMIIVAALLYATGRKPPGMWAE